MNYASEKTRQAEVLRRLAFASRWSLPPEDELLESELQKAEHDGGVLYEPCALGEETMSLPVEMFALGLEDLQSLFSIETWHSLDPSSKEHLKKFLPTGRGAPNPDTVVEKLFSGENVKFGNPMVQFCKDLLAGEYHAEVQRYKQHVENLERQQRLLSMKIYHNRFVKHVIEEKLSMGMKVDEGVEDFYATQPDDADLGNKRRLSRAHAAVAKRMKRRKNDKQFTSLITTATALARQKDNEHGVGSYNQRRLLSTLQEIGFHIPTKLSIGLPDGDEELWLSDDDEMNSDTASAASTDNEENVIPLIETLSNRGNKRNRNPKKRKRTEVAEGSEEGEGPEAQVEEEEPLPTKQKLWPPFSNDEIFCLFPQIRRALTAPNLLSSAGKPTEGVSFKEIVDSVRSVPRLVDQVPHGMSLEKMVCLSLELLRRVPITFGMKLSARKVGVLGPSAATREPATSGQLKQPFLKIVDSNVSALDAPEARFLWFLPPNHVQNDYLESLETVFFMAITRGFLTTSGKMIDFERIRSLQHQATLPSFPDQMIEEFREQELERYNKSDQPFTYTTVRTQPLQGHSSSYTAMALPSKITVPNRRSLVLRAERPSTILNTSIVRDAIARLPGGVGTRGDLIALFLQSSFVSTNSSDLSVASSIVTASLERLELEWDSTVRFDSDLQLYINTHRHRSIEELSRAQITHEELRSGHSSALWKRFHDLRRSSDTPSVNLDLLLKGRPPII